MDTRATPVVTRTTADDPDLDVVVVGCGFAGLYALHRLRSDGWRVRALEAADGVGGTWYHNRYPGARCDVQSQAYAFTFDDDLRRGWRWTERYPRQREILAYLDYVADRLDLRPDIVLGARVESAVHDDEAGRWRVTTADGATVTATYLVMATGPLSVARFPDIPGLETFAGTVAHTAAWPEDGRGDYAGRRVAVIGTGSSAVQAIPEIAAEAAHVTVFQRTPAYVVPAHHAPLGEAEADAFDRRFAEYREGLLHGLLVGSGDVVVGDHLPPTTPFADVEADPDRVRELLEGRWAVGGATLLRTFADLMKDERANAAVSEFVRAKIGEIVEDPETARALTPLDYPIGSKRVCVGSGYYEAFNRDDVVLVDLQAEPIEEIVPEGVRTARGTHPADLLVVATGFDALTGALTRIDIVGAGGARLRDVWEHGATSYLGAAVSGFPNLFTLVGPGSPSALSNVVMAIEQHVEWVADLLAHARSSGIDRIEADPDAEDRWSRHVAESAEGTLFLRGKSWYLGANVPGKPRVFLPYIRGLGEYRKVCDDVARRGYEGFRLARHAGIRGG